MRWLCILFPQLALDAVLRSREDANAPLVLLSGPPQRRGIGIDLAGYCRQLTSRPVLRGCDQDKA